VGLLEEKDERFKNLFGKSAVFILVALLGIGLTFVWSEVKKGAFTAKSPVYFVADSGTDLSEGMPVKFSGFKIGKLNSLALDAQGHVQVEVSIESQYLGLLREDAVVTLIKEGVIGDGVLAISRGTENKPVLQAGGKVGFEREKGLAQAVTDVKDRVMPILDDVYKTLNDPQGDVNVTLKNLRDFSSEIRGIGANLDRVLKSLDTTLNSDVGPMMKSLRQTAENAESLTGKLDQELPALMLKADTTMGSLSKASETLNEAVQRAAPQLPGIIGETRALIGDTQEAVDSLSSSWPFKGDTPAPETGTIGMDSHD
jgi:phospholipid/cholesterol/gamma-HCH transport system substrate-binding protein